VPGPKTGPHFYDNTGDTPDVGFTAITIRATDNLRCHPENSPLHRCGIIVIRIDVVCKESAKCTIFQIQVRRTAVLRNAKVRDLADTFQIDEDVVGFEISMQDISRM
jgi:hypothetical protein